MSLPYWEYFLSIESDLERCSRFVEFSSDNYETYSIEFARIIMAAAAEFDTLAKPFCNLIDPKSNPNNIKEYFPIITKKYPKFVEYEIEIPRYNLFFTPWKDWTSSANPDWWVNGYNKIKHNRDDFYKNANLKNAILASSGLLVGILYFLSEIYGGPPTFEFQQSPRLLAPKNYDTTNNAQIGFSYDFPQ